MNGIKSVLTSFILAEHFLINSLISIFCGLFFLSNIFYLFINNDGDSYIRMLDKLRHFSATEIALLIITGYFVSRLMNTCIQLFFSNKSKTLTIRDNLQILEGFAKEHRKYIKDEIDDIRLNVFFHLSFAASFLFNGLAFIFSYIRCQQLHDLVAGLCFLVICAILMIRWRSLADYQDKTMISIKDITRADPMRAE